MGFIERFFRSFEERSDNAPILLVKTTDSTDGVSKTAIGDSNGVELILDALVESIPTTETFHYLGHLGKVFIHGERHSEVADGANFDMLIRIPAGNAARQIHFRFNYASKANTGTLDVDVMLYREPTTTADGSTETIVSTNDAIVKTTGVLMFSAPTVTAPGTYMTSVNMFGEKKSAGSKETDVPEWILAPDGANSRDYLMRLTNNSGGTIDFNHALFFYDSEAV